MALLFDPRFGGQPTSGDATANLGNDCVISLGGGPEIYQISQIIATYVSPFVLDYDRGAGTTGPGPDAIRSFTGRLSVLAGPQLKDSLSTAPPNTQLFTKYPDGFRVVFDMFIHDWLRPHIFQFPTVPGMGALISQPGEFLNVILLQGNSYTDPGGVVNAQVFQSLHINAVMQSSNPRVQLGPFHAE